MNVILNGELLEEVNCFHGMDDGSPKNINNFIFFKCKFVSYFVWNNVRKFHEN